MAIQLSTTIRNVLLNQIETQTGTSAILKIFAGAVPANCAAADAATTLATLSLPSDWMAAASGGSKAMSGTWEDASADNSGTATHFRIYETTATTCHLQGTCSASGGGGDMILSTTSITAGDTFTINTFTLTAPGA